jgi:hypothetical protein
MPFPGKPTPRKAGSASGRYEKAKGDSGAVADMRRMPKKAERQTKHRTYDTRCSAKSASGTRCIFKQGHAGSHSIRVTRNGHASSATMMTAGHKARTDRQR